MVASTVLVRLVSFSLFATISLSWSPLWQYKSYIAEKRANSDSYAFLVNCWASPGARSEVDFFTEYPSDFGSATPDHSSIVLNNENYVWENGGSVSDGNGGTFTWGDLKANASTNAQVGKASDGQNNYIVLKDTESTLYKPDNFNCVVIYRAQMNNGPGAITTTVTAAQNATSTTTASAAPATTTATSTAVTEDSSNGDTGLSSGAKAGIGVGVALGALAIIVAVAFFIWRARRAKGYKSGEPMTGVFSNEKGPTESAGFANAAPATLRAELHDSPVAELGDTDHRMVEAEGDTARTPMSPQELESTSQFSPR